MQHGEWGEAYELVCIQLHEFDIPIMENVLVVLQETGVLLDADPLLVSELRILS